MRDRQQRENPAIASGLEQNGLLHIIEPERAVGKAATEKLAEALADIIASDALDGPALSEPFHELALGYYGDLGLAQMTFGELRSRKLVRDSEDGVSIPMHPMVRSLVLALLSQFLRPNAKEIGADLSPATDRAEIVSALANLLN